MTDIRFLCPECQSKLAVDGKAAGRSVPCPICSKKITIPPSLSLPISTTFTEPLPSPRCPHPEFPNIGNFEAFCPYCNQQLQKRPSKKKECPHCGKIMYVRTRPSDEQQVLVTETQAEQIAEQWSMVNGTHDAYLAAKNDFADEKAKLAKRFGREPSDNDVRWSQLNQELIEHARRRNWGLFRNAKFEMAEILRKEGKQTDALGLYLEVCYLDLNGPNNTNGITDLELLGEYPPWNPNAPTADLAPGILDRAFRTMEKAEMDRASVEELYIKRASMLHDSFCLPLMPAAAWPPICDAIFEDG